MQRLGVGYFLRTHQNLWCNFQAKNSPRGKFCRLNLTFLFSVFDFVKEVTTTLPCKLRDEFFLGDFIIIAKSFQAQKVDF